MMGGGRETPSFSRIYDASSLVCRGGHIYEETFHRAVRAIKDQYPEDCFRLYKERIDSYLEEVRGRELYR